MPVAIGNLEIVHALISLLRFPCCSGLKGVAGDLTREGRLTSRYAPTRASY